MMRLVISCRPPQVQSEGSAQPAQPASPAQPSPASQPASPAHSDTEQPASQPAYGGDFFRRTNPLTGENTTHPWSSANPVGLQRCILVETQTHYALDQKNQAQNFLTNSPFTLTGPLAVLPHYTYTCLYIATLRANPKHVIIYMHRWLSKSVLWTTWKAVAAESGIGRRVVRGECALRARSCPHSVRGSEIPFSGEVLRWAMAPHHANPEDGHLIGT